MKEISYIETDLKKIMLLSEIYENISKSEISTEEDLNVAKLKAKVAKEDMLKLTQKINSLLLNAQEHLK